MANRIINNVDYSSIHRKKNITPFVCNKQTKIKSKEMKCQM